ncbi:MAG: enoyl-CoA hydratase/isomerase family protein [Solirubrobacterales bacterium]|nr:enoyl-CoA hydratase/isomerase family protein [Solirubrobacterales bacterium]
MFVHKAAVVGGGTMGGQIAQAIAASDTPVVIKDVDQKFVDHAIEEVKNVTSGQLGGLVKKEKLTQEQADARLAEVMGLVTGTTSYDEFGDVDFVIEAVPEKMAIKQAVFAELDAVTPGHAILSSNTSGLSISEMAEATIRPDKVVGFHFFYPASVMPLVEVVIGDETTTETVQSASNFAQAIGKQPITCGEVPGFVVNRILNSAVSEIWRAQEEQSLSIAKIDEGVGAANVAPMGPFILADMLGLDTVFHVAENLNDAYGDSFYVHQGMKKLVSEGKLGAKTGGEGLYKDGQPNIGGDGEADAEDLADLFTAKALIEACLLLEEGVASVRDIDVGMMAGAGLDPRRGLFPPFWKADIEGVDKALEKIEALHEKHGDRFAPPVTLKRLVAQKRFGIAAGQGIYPWARPDEAEQTEQVKLQTRGPVAIAWLSNPPMNAIAPQVIEDLGTVWEKVKANPEIGAMIIASSMPIVYSAGADIKKFTQMDTEGGAALINNGHELLRDFGKDRVVTIAAVNSLAFGGGCELAMACDFRIAAESAVFGQPEIKLGIIPGFGGTQRLPRLVGGNQALEMNLVGDPISSLEALEYGLVTRVVPDQELFDTAMNWGVRLAGQAPIAVEQIKKVSFAGGDADAGIDAEKQGFATAFLSEDAKEGIGAFLGKRTPKWCGK